MSLFPVRNLDPVCQSIESIKALQRQRQPVYQEVLLLVQRVNALIATTPLAFADLSSVIGITQDFLLNTIASKLEKLGSTEMKILQVAEQKLGQKRLSREGNTHLHNLGRPTSCVVFVGVAPDLTTGLNHDSDFEYSDSEL